MERVVEPVHDVVRVQHRRVGVQEAPAAPKVQEDRRRRPDPPGGQLVLDDAEAHEDLPRATGSIFGEFQARFGQKTTPVVPR